MHDLYNFLHFNSTLSFLLIYIQKVQVYLECCKFYNKLFVYVGQEELPVSEQNATITNQNVKLISIFKIELYMYDFKLN